LSALVLTLAVFGYANAKFAFPVPSYYAAEKAFRTVQRSISWDPTNLLTDLAGPLATCDRLSDWGPAGKKTAVNAETVWNATRIDPVFFPSRESYVVYYFILTATGADARSVHNDIKGSIDSMRRSGFSAPPFNDFNTDLLSTIRFGCSVEPQCPTTAGTAAKTVVVCLFQQAVLPQPYFLQGFNETWLSHSHDAYSAVAAITLPDGLEFPGYSYVEDENLVKTVVGNDLCDKHAYDPVGFRNTVAAYWSDPNRSPNFIHEATDTSIFGYYLGSIASPGATSLDFIRSNADNSMPASFKSQVMYKMLTANPQRDSILAKNPPVALNMAACVIAVCPNRYLPRGPPGGKQTVKGNFVVAACMTYLANLPRNEAGKEQ
jgi:hypothetical protein